MKFVNILINLHFKSRMQGLINYLFFLFINLLLYYFYGKFNKNYTSDNQNFS